MENDGSVVSQKVGVLWSTNGVAGAVGEPAGSGTGSGVGATGDGVLAALEVLWLCTLPAGLVLVVPDATTFVFGGGVVGGDLGFAVVLVLVLDLRACLFFLTILKSPNS